MKTLLLIAGLVAATATAGTVTYSTTGSIACNGVTGCTTITNGVTVTQGAAVVTLVFDINGGTSITAPSNINYGDINSSLTSGTTAVNLTGLLVTLNVMQTVPTNANGTFGNGSVTGTLSGTSSSSSIVWNSPTTILIGTELYTVFTPTTIVSPSSNAGVTTIQGAVADAGVPEPTTILLLGGGLGAFGLIRRRRVV